MRIIVDLIHCQSYGQCIFAAPTVFRFIGEHALVSGDRGLGVDYAPDDALLEQGERAVTATP
jgi:ferredoxin